MNSLLNLPNVLVHSFVKQVEPVEVCLGSVCLTLWTCVWAVVNYLPLFYEAILVCAFLSLETE